MNSKVTSFQTPKMAIAFNHDTLSLEAIAQILKKADLYLYYRQTPNGFEMGIDLTSQWQVFEKEVLSKTGAPPRWSVLRPIAANDWKDDLLINRQTV